MQAVLILAIALLLPSWGQEWRPPDVSAPKALAGPPAGARPVSPALAATVASRLAGPEAAGLARWLEGREQLWLAPEGEGWRLSERGESIALSQELGRSLERVRQYFALTEETLAKPISFEELSAAVTSPSGVAEVRKQFEAMIGERLQVGGKFLFSERGGEATLEGSLSLHEWPEPTRGAMPRLAAAIDDEAELARLIQEDPGVQLLDESGLLKSLVRMMPGWHARGDAPEKVAKVRRLTVMTLLENGAASFVFDPASQLDAIRTQDWSGRFIGHWHLHPPHWAGRGFSGGGEPSPPDMEIAVKAGQNLTIAFEPDGFSAYDLSAMADAGKVDLKLIRVIRYRSADWQRRFAALHTEIGNP